MLTEKDTVQREKDELMREIRHLCNTVTCPIYISVDNLIAIKSLLKGEKQHE